MKDPKIASYAQYASIILLDIAGIVLIGAQFKTAGWLILALGALALFLTKKQFREEILLIFISIALLGITPINTAVSNSNFIIMGTLLGLALILPYAISKYVYKRPAVEFKLHHGRKWNKKEILYIFLTGFITYLLFPFMLLNTGSYANWTVEASTEGLFRLFIGTNVLGIWDELFFICTVLGILRRHFEFKIANLAQAVLFTSFLYDLGFRGWAAIIIFFFALLQGFIFKKTESLFYVVTIHLTADFILFLALIYTHHPELISVFLIK